MHMCIKQLFFEFIFILIISLLFNNSNSIGTYPNRINNFFSTVEIIKILIICSPYMAIEKEISIKFNKKDLKIGT